MDLRVRRSSGIRVLLKPEDGLRSLVERAPQAEAWAGRQIEQWRPVWEWLYEARRRLATTAVVLLTAWFFLHVMFGPNGMVVYRQKRAEYHALQKENGQLQKEYDAYQQRIKSLESDPKTIEKEAREQLHYARPGEVIYVAPAPSAPQAPANHAASK
jgi:cell division protein FtsB